MTARITEYGEKNLSGAVSSAFITLPIEKEKRKMASPYADNPDLWVLPIQGDGSKLAEIRIATETDGTNVWVTGLEKPRLHGYGYTNIRGREDEWAKMCPGISAEEIELNLFRIGGPGKMISSILHTAVMIKKTIQKTDVQATTDQTKFNRYGICRLFAEGDNKINVLSGKAPEEKIINPSIHVEFQNTDGTTIDASATFSGSQKDVSEGSGGGGKGGFGATITADDIESVSSQSYYSDTIIQSSLRNVNAVTASADVATKSLTKYESGGTLTGSDGTKYNITSVTKPNINGMNIDPYKTEILTRNVSVVDFTQYSQESQQVT